MFNKIKQFICAHIVECREGQDVFGGYRIDLPDQRSFLYANKRICKGCGRTWHHPIVG